MKLDIKSCMWALGIAATIVAVTACSSNGNDSQSPFPSYEAIPVMVYVGDYVSMANAKGEIVVDNEYPDAMTVYPASEGMFWAVDGDKVNLYSLSDPKNPVADMNSLGIVYQALPFAGGKTLIQQDNDPVQIVNTKLNVVATLEPWAAQLTRSGNKCLIARVPNEDRSQTEALIDSETGRVIIAPGVIGAIIGCNEGIAVGYDSNTGKLAFVDIENPSKIKLIDGFENGDYSVMANEFHSGLLACSDSDGRLVYFNKDGEKSLTIRDSDVSNLYPSGPGFSFYGGYAVFADGSDKYGVIDTKGEKCIRPKYAGLENMGYGRFMACRGDKWGLIDANDNVLTKFEYVSWKPFTVGDNFIVKNDIGMWEIIDREGKQVRSYYNVMGETPESISYINLNPTLDAIMQRIAEVEEAISVAEYAKTDKLIDIDKISHYDTRITIRGDVWPAITFVENIVFGGERLLKEKTHQETVNDGWFAHDVTVSDGWDWSDASMTFCEFVFNVSAGYISSERLMDVISDKLVKEGFSKDDRQGFSLTKRLGDDSDLHCGFFIDGHIVKLIVEKVEETGC